MPQTPVGRTTFTSTLQEATMTTPQAPQFVPLAGMCLILVCFILVCFTFYVRFIIFLLLCVVYFVVPPQYEERHAASGSSYSASDGTLVELDLSQYLSFPQPTQPTQEITEEVPQRQETRPTNRFSPADYERPRPPASARKLKRPHGERQARGRGQG